MFYSQLVLAKKGPLGKIWLAAHMERKVPKLSIIETNIPESVENIETVPMALRVSGHLLLGVVRIFSRKVTYLLTDCSEALVKIKDAFRAPGGVELAPGAGTKSYDEVTRHDQLDEMDLDADLTDQQMLFTIEDGIELPDGIDGIELPEPEKDDLAGPAGLPEQEGFAADEKLDCLGDFFPESMPAAEEEEDEEEEDDDKAGLDADELPAKRRRPSPAKEPEMHEDEDEDEELRPERLMSHGGDLAGGVDMLPEVDEPMISDEFEDCRPPLEEEGEDELERPLPPEPEEEGEGEGDEEDGLHKVMDSGRKQRDRTPAPSPMPNNEKAKRANPRPKRKMIVDEETQLSAEFLRSQLDNPSDIVRDFKAEAAARASKSRRNAMIGHGARYDPLVDAPRLFYLPSNIASMSCFWPKGRMPAPKRMRVAHAETRLEDDDEGEDEGEEDVLEAEVPRSASKGDGVQQVGGLAAPASEFEHDVQKDGEELQDEEVEPQDEAMDPLAEEEPFDEPLPPPEDEPEAEEPEDEVEQPTGFNPALELPNVDQSNVEGDDGNEPSTSQSAPLGSHDPAAWNPRTRKMYAVLQAAFDKSDSAPLSYDAMIKRTRKSADKRKVVAGCFQELLFLTTHGMIELEQNKAYGNILISKTELFGKIATA